MTVQELIELLERCDEDAEVRFAHQASWPFEYDIRTVVEVDVCEIVGDGEGAVVYLVEGDQLGYLPGYVAETIGWR